jgi:hypothetical protein
MAIKISPLEKFRLLKAGLPIPESTPSPERIVSAEISPVDPGVGNDPQSGPASFKKPTEPCPHPPYRLRKDTGPLVGTITVCLDCGRQVKDPDLAD